MSKNFTKLVHSGQTVYSISDGMTIFRHNSKNSTRKAFSRLKNRGVLINVQKGLWALKDYNKYELANKLVSSSYISLETVLYEHGFVFQSYTGMVLSISNKRITKSFDNIKYEYHKIQDNILYEPLGIKNIDNQYQIASLERAICDRIYLTSGYYFDNFDIDQINIDKLKKLSSLYNKRTFLEIKNLINDSTSK